MKKMISAIMAICIMMCSLSMSVSANSVIDYVEPGIELMYLYTDNVSTSVYRSGSNIAYKCDAKGKSTATKISIYLYLQEYSNGAWSNVDVVTKAPAATPQQTDATGCAMPPGSSLALLTSTAGCSGWKNCSWNVIEQ